MNLRCYCCGEELCREFALVSMQTNVDRVFTMKLEHVDRVEDVEFIEVCIHE